MHMHRRNFNTIEPTSGYLEDATSRRVITSNVQLTTTCTCKNYRRYATWSNRRPLLAWEILEWWSGSSLPQGSQCLGTFWILTHFSGMYVYIHLLHSIRKVYCCKTLRASYLDRHFAGQGVLMSCDCQFSENHRNRICLSDLLFGCLFRKCIFPRGVAKEPPKMGWASGLFILATGFPKRGFLLWLYYLIGTPKIYTTTGLGPRKNREMVGVDDLVVYMQTAVKYSSSYIHHLGGAARPRGGVYRKCCILQQYMHHQIVHTSHFPIFARPQPGGGVYLWGPNLMRRVPFLILLKLLNSPKTVFVHTARRWELHRLASKAFQYCVRLSLQCSDGIAKVFSACWQAAAVQSSLVSILSAVTFRWLAETWGLRHHRMDTLLGKQVRRRMLMDSVGLDNAVHIGCIHQAFFSSGVSGTRRCWAISVRSSHMIFHFVALHGAMFLGKSDSRNDCTI